jgi:hypothetical protein
LTSFARGSFPEPRVAEPVNVVTLTLQREVGGRPPNVAANPVYASSVQAYALVELGDTEAVDIFVRRADADAALADCLRDEPEWIDVLCAVPIELDEPDVSAD